MTGPRASAQVYRVRWLPGTDTLLGICHCGAEHTAQEPIELWDWLLAHPAGHRPPATAGPPGGTPLTAGAATG
ncbi:hypothetical protein GCM10023196_019260 [Actinoallomurus vinaceus]|uniref:Uncharacterized protein n=1 Tax=Actinoallomurus vinaceus TaxID=1080074 RepID=A0ABP8U4A3_9ACTN